MPEQDPIYDVTPVDAHDTQNPYAAPAAMNAPPVWGPEQPNNAFIWNYGDKLILRRGVELPHICVKSNTPNPQHRKRRKIQWSPPWVPLLLLLGLLPFLIVSIILTKRATIVYSVTDEHNRRRRTAILVGWLIGLSSLGAGIFSLAMLANGLRPDGSEGMWWMLFLFSLIGGIVGLLYGNYVALPFRPAKIDSDYIILKGMNPSFVLRFPNWPYQPL